MANNYMATQEAGRALADVLKTNSVLNTLELSDNAWVYRGLDNLRPDGKGFANELALGLSGQPTGALLKNLNISGNQIPRETLNQLIPLCKDSPKMQVLCGVPFKNMSMTHLDVSGKHLGVEVRLCRHRLPPGQ